MKRISVILSLIVLFAAVSVQAQKSSRRIPTPKPPQPEYNNVITVEDDATGNYLLLDVLSGTYKFNRCSDGAGMAGYATVQTFGCEISMQDIQKDHRVMIYVNVCTHEAKAAIEEFTQVGKPFDGGGMQEYLSDNDMRDSTPNCAPKKQ